MSPPRALGASSLLDELLLRYGDGWEHEWDEVGRRLGRPIAYPPEWLAQLGFAQEGGEGQE